MSRECPLDILPLYVRAGSIVPMRPSVQHVSEKPGAPYEIRIYLGTDAKVTLYEDDNETYAYEKGQRATVEMKWNDISQPLTIGESNGTFPGMAKSREFRVVIARKGRGNGINEVTGDRAIRYDGSRVVVEF